MLFDMNPPSSTPNTLTFKKTALSGPPQFDVRFKYDQVGGPVDSFTYTERAATNEVAEFLQMIGSGGKVTLNINVNTVSGSDLLRVRHPFWPAFLSYSTMDDGLTFEQCMGRMCRELDIRGPHVRHRCFSVGSNDWIPSAFSGSFVVNPLIPPGVVLVCNTQLIEQKFSTLLWFGEQSLRSMYVCDKITHIHKLGRTGGLSPNVDYLSSVLEPGFPWLFNAKAYMS